MAKKAAPKRKKAAKKATKKAAPKPKATAKKPEPRDPVLDIGPGT